MLVSLGIPGRANGLLVLLRVLWILAILRSRRWQRIQRDVDINSAIVVVLRVLGALRVMLSEMRRKGLVEWLKRSVVGRRSDLPRRARWRRLETDIRLDEALVRLGGSCHIPGRIDAIHAILEDDTLVVSLALSLRLDAVVAGWTLFAALYATFPTGWDQR